MELISQSGDGLTAVLRGGALCLMQPTEISTSSLLLPKICKQQSKHGTMRGRVPQTLLARKSKAYSEG